MKKLLFTFAAILLVCCAPKSQIIEKEVEVKNGEYTLPATLTLPVAKEKLPVVILVHGSGPNDRDESVLGINKPFKDLADSLAAKGIATLRYDKRTFVYHGKFVSADRENNFTPDDETVDDAVAAVALAKTFNEIDSTKVFVLGHSLGAQLAPRIAERAKLSGIIVMSAPSRNFDTIFIEQLKYLIPQQVPPTYSKLQIDSLINETYAKAKSSATESYWEYLRNYNAVETAAALNISVLVLQGERDYQVTMRDFELWKNGLSGKQNAVLKSYPKLNHLYLEGEGKSTPQEYMKASHIPAYVINDIADFIISHSEQREESDKLKMKSEK